MAPNADRRLWSQASAQGVSFLVMLSEGGRRLHARVREGANDLLSDLLDTFDAEDREHLAS